MAERLLKYDHILFDFDGTLCDTEKDLRHAWHRIIAESGRELPNFEEIYRIGPPLQDTVRLLFPDLSPEEQFRTVEKFKSIYDCSSHDRTRAYPWIDGWLRLLRNNGCKLYVVTNKRIKPANFLIEKYNWSELFTVVYTPDMNTGKFYQKSETIAMLLKEFAIDSNSAIMVGDMAGDIIAGKNNGIATAGVTWGYGSREELLNAQCDILLSQKDFES